MAGEKEKRLYSFLSGYILNNKWLFAGGVICLSAGLLVSLAIPEILRWFIDSTIIDDKTLALKYLNLLVAVSLSVYVLKGLLHYLKECLLSLAAFRTVLEMRSDAFRRVEHYSMSFFHKKRVGSLVSSLTSNFSTVEDFLVNSLPGFIAQPVIILGIIILVFLTHWKLALIAMLIFPFLFYTISKFGNRIKESSEKVQAGLSGIVSFLQENFSSIRVVKVFCRENEEIERFGKLSKRVLFNSMEGTKSVAVMTPIVEMISCIGVVVFFWYGGREVIDGRLTTGELVKFITYVTMLVPPLKNLSVDFTRLHKMKGVLKEVVEVYFEDDCIKEKRDAYDLPRVKGEICFKEVSLRYPGDSRPVLYGVSFAVKAGEAVAVVGRSGSGKTSMVNLIPRLYDPEGGIITIDGHDLKDVTLESLRSQIAIVPQEISLFHQSVYHNIAYGRKNATEGEIMEAARRAHAHDFIKLLPEGYHTIVGERGERLSAGQKQRIALARAILANPSILILDEATSYLDAESEHLIREALDSFMKARTTFIVAHRMSTVLNADRAIVIDSGRIAEMGTHDELMMLKGIYYNLFNMGMKVKRLEGD